MAEMATVAVRADITGENHTADLSFVTGVPDHRSKLSYAMCELAVVAVRTGAGLLPLVAQLRFQHSLVVHV
ncbi:hypothetical protein LguiA_005919 [Lonicera macranthoides]